MKYYLSILCVISSFTIFSQEEMTIEQIREFTFGNLNKNEITTGILMNSVIPIVDFRKYNGNNLDTIDYESWQQLLISLDNGNITNNSIIDNYLRIDSISNTYIQNNIIPLGLIDIQYNIIKDNAIEDNLLQILNGQVLDIYPRNSSPYLILQCFSLCPTTIQFETDSKNISYKFPDNLIISNTNRILQTIEIDFDDGNGYRTIQQNGLYSINYEEFGYKNIKTKILIQKQYLFSNSKIYIGPNLLKSGSDDDYGTVPEKISTYNISIYSPHENKTVYGTYGIYYSDCNTTNKMKKPVVIVEGFDPMNNKAINEKKENRNLYAIYDTDEHILDKLREAGFDIIILDFKENTIDLRASAFLLVELIKKINSDLKVPNSELIVMGRSGGGLVARYALTYMEKHSIDHYAKLLITFDTPHQGANVPLGLQYFLKDFSKLLFPDLIEVDKAIHNLIDNTYAKQILYYHNSTSPNSKKTEFFADLQALGNYPMKLKKIAISSGNGYGVGRDFAPGANLVYKNTNENDFRNVNMSIKALPNGSGTIYNHSISIRFPICISSFCFKPPCPQTCYFTPWVQTKNVSYNVSNVLPYDNAPGGGMPWHNYLRNYINKQDDLTCFVPVISSLDIQKNILPSDKGGLFYNIHTNLPNYSNIVKVSETYFINLNIQTITPFDVIYFNSYNATHSHSSVGWHDLFEKEIYTKTAIVQNQQIIHNKSIYGENEIKLGKNVSSTIPQGDVIIKNNCNLKLKSGNSIIIPSGFTVEKGATLDATIQKEFSCSTTAFNNQTFDVYNTIIESEEQFSISEISKQEYLLSFNGYGSNSYNISIFDSQGGLVSNTESFQRSVLLDIPSKKSGLYTVEITMNNYKYYTTLSL
jgi:hypothetical protein